MKKSISSWLNLFLGLILLLSFIIALHCISGRIPGTIGKLFKKNQNENLEVYAYVYSELGDIKEFLDDKNGKYGKTTMRKSLK